MDEDSGVFFWGEMQVNELVCVYLIIGGAVIDFIENFLGVMLCI